MLTKPMTTTALKQLFMEAMLNITSNVSKISDNGVLGGVSYGVAKIGQKVMKEIALVESHLFVDSAFGDNLDSVAERLGVSARYGALASSTFIRLVGDSGILYEAGTHIFSGSHGIQFELTEDVTIGTHGYTYAKVRSTTTGLQTNVDAVSISTISPTPTGHNYVVNEVSATGGRDSESDNLFRERIKNSINIAATDTISKLEQVFIKLNNNILRIYYQGVDDDGKNVLAITTQNGEDLTVSELSDLEDQAAKYLSVSDLSPYGYGSIGITLQNSDWEYIDLDFRGELADGASITTVRQNIQIRLTKYLDFRFWKSTDKVEWDRLLSIVRDTEGMKNVSDNEFYPRSDITVAFTKLPRLRGFIMRDLDGSIISSIDGILNPIYYPNVEDIDYNRTILGTIE
jgi:hypothetical protein